MGNWHYRPDLQVQRLLSATYLDPRVGRLIADLSKVKGLGPRVMHCLENELGRDGLESATIECIIHIDLYLIPNMGVKSRQLLLDLLARE
jgi:hypothetical protein